MEKSKRSTKGVKKSYLKGLTPSQQKKKVANIKKSKELVKKGKKKEAAKLASKRPTTKKGKKTSSFTMSFKKKFPGVKPLSKEFAKATGIPMKAQKEVFKKGEGAFVSAGSRATVGNAQQWAYARLYAFYIKGKRGDLNFDKDIVKKYKIKFK